MPLTPMLSYGQNHEDVFLRRRLFPDQESGFYIDVGANDPVLTSVTKHFYDAGWSGINIEPVRSLHERHLAERPCDINLNVGISNRPGQHLFHEASGVHSGLSTFSATLAAQHRERGIPMNDYTVAVTTLAAITDRYVHGPIDFMSIDVEGFERAVLEGADWQRWRPRVLLIESTIPLTNVPSHEQWEPLLFAADYLFAAFDGLNRYYLRAEDRKLLPALAAPVNDTDSYIPYAYHREIERLNRELQNYRSVEQQIALAGAELPVALAIARRLHRLSLRFPVVHGLMGRLYRAVQRRAA